jgi:hypothetical protein
MLELATLSKLQTNIAEDPRVTVWHISLYNALLNIWQQTGFEKQIKVTRKILMAKAHFGSTSTYHKCLNKLIELNYISYNPTYDCYKGSRIEIKLADQ